MVIMDRCPDCTAPNPRGRDHCWSCKASLAQPTGITPPPAPTTPAPPPPSAAPPAPHPLGMDAYRRWCMGCGKDFGVFNRTCPHCGAAVTGGHTAGSASHPAAAVISPPFGGIAPTPTHGVPPDWELTPDTAGTTRLRLSRRGRLRIGGGALLALLIPFTLVLFTWVRIWAGEPTFFRYNVSTLLVSVPFTLVWAYLNRNFIRTALFNALGREEWHAAPGRLEVHRELWGRSWRHTYDTGTLVLKARVVRHLRGFRLDSWLWLETPSGRKLLCTRTGRRGLDELEALGPALSQLTGWPYHVPEDVRDLNVSWFSF